MGFIDYKGTKEDRYLDVVEYAKAQQEENWKKRQAIRVSNWLEELNGKSYLADLSIQDYLKSIIIEYRKLFDFWNSKLIDIKDVNGVSKQKVWEDFLNDLVLRHIDALHIVPEDKEKIFLSFYGKVFKFSIDDDETIYDKLTENTQYRKYLAECFDPTWKGQQFYRYIYILNKQDKEFINEYISFLDDYSLLGLNISLYLNQLFHPRDDGWMIQESSELKAISDIKLRIQKKSFSKPDINSFRNPFMSKNVKQQETNIKDVEQNSIKSNCLNRVLFDDYIKKGDITSLLEAGAMILECNLPDDIKEIYGLLIPRMRVLNESMNEFKEIYQVDLTDFIEFYAPETLQISATFLDYQVAAPSEEILNETKENVLSAARKLLQVVNEKIDELYMFVTMETNAKAKALEAVMIQDGYVDPNYKINENGGV